MLSKFYTIDITFVMKKKRQMSSLNNMYQKEQQKFKTSSFQYGRFENKLISPEDWDVEIIAWSDVWRFDVMAEENESEQQVVNMRSMDW